MPSISEIRAIKKTLVRVRFDASIFGNPLYLDPDNYIFNENLKSLGIVVVNESTVDVITTPQETDKFYTVEYRSK